MSQPDPNHNYLKVELDIVVVKPKPHHQKLKLYAKPNWGNTRKTKFVCLYLNIGNLLSNHGTVPGEKCIKNRGTVEPFRQ